MKRTVLIGIIFLLLLVSVTGCSDIPGKYIKIDQGNGITSYLDTESISYNKTTGIISFWERLEYDDSAKKSETTRWAKQAPLSNKNPFLSMSYLLSLSETHIEINKFHTLENNFFDSNGNQIHRAVQDKEEEWFSVPPEDYFHKMKAEILSILKKQGKI